MPTLGQKIRDHRMGKNLSQEALAADFNIARQTVSKWENGEAIPNTDNITALAKYFGVTVEYLTATDGKENFEVAATTDTTKNKKKRPNVRWIVGVILSCIIPMIFIALVLVSTLSTLDPIYADGVGTENFLDWTFFWIMFALTIVSIAALVALIVVRVKKRKKLNKSDKMSPKGDRQL